MSTDLIALVVALGLGAVVIVLGLRRNLSETTRNGLPRFENDAEQATATLGLYEGEERPRRPPSPRQRIWLGAFCLLIALGQAVSALQLTDDWLLRAGAAVLFALEGAFFLWQGFSRASGGSAP